MLAFGASMFFTDYSMTPAELGRAGGRGFESLWAPEHSHIPVSRARPSRAAATCRRSTTT